TGEPVLDELMFFTPPTLIIAGWSMLLVLLVSLPLGVIAAIRYQTWMDTLIRVVTSATVSIPSYFLGILFVFFLAQSTVIFPASGIDSPVGYALPVLSMSIGLSAYYIQIGRAHV